MKLSSISGLVLAGLVTAYSLPRDLQETAKEGVTIGANEPDGLYQGTWGPDGKVANTIFTPLSTSLTERDTVERRALPINHLACGTGTFNAGEWNAAWGAFTNACDGGLGANGFYWVGYKVGNAIAWMCNKQNSWNRCFRSEYDEFVNVLSVNCGGLTPGYTDVDAWGKSYGRNLADQAFCNSRWP